MRDRAAAHHPPDADPDVALAGRDAVLLRPAGTPGEGTALSWWARRRAIRECAFVRRHCWHPSDGLIGWACCCCPAETDGIPPDRCLECDRRRHVRDTVAAIGEALDVAGDRWVRVPGTFREVRQAYGDPLGVLRYREVD